MKIAVIISNTRDPNTGTATVSINLAQKFRIRGHDCDLIFKEDVLTRPEGVPQQILFALIMPFRKRLASYDILDINAGDGFFAAVLLRRIRRLKAPILISRSHGLEHVAHQTRLIEARANRLKLSWKYPFYHGGYRLWQVKKYLQCADLALFLNAYDRDFAIRHLRVDPSRAKVADVGLPDIFIGRRFDPAPRPKLKIAVIGSFIVRKGVGYAVPALETLLKRNDHLSVGFFGSRVPAGQILDLFSMPVRDRVEIKEDYAQDDLPGLLSSYRILVFASLAEGFPLAPLEAMACGLAIVVTEIPGIAERLTHEINALIVPPRDRYAIEAAVQRLIDDDALLLRIRQAGHELAQRFSWSRVTDDTLGLYAEAIARRSAEIANR